MAGTPAEPQTGDIRQAGTTATLLGFALCAVSAGVTGGCAKATHRPQAGQTSPPATAPGPLPSGTTTAATADGPASATRPGDGSARLASPAAGIRTFVHGGTKTRLAYPSTWVAHPSADYALLLAPAGVDPADASLSLDVPDLPPHLPGWIPIGMVRNGYVDDVRQAHPKATVADLPPPDVAGAKSRLVRSEWDDARGPCVETALILVRGDHVLILRGNSRPPHGPGTREAFDAVVQSLTWDH